MQQLGQTKAWTETGQDHSRFTERDGSQGMDSRCMKCRFLLPATQLYGLCTEYSVYFRWRISHLSDGHLMLDDFPPCCVD